MRLKNKHFAWIKEARCPSCGTGNFEFIKTEYNGILVNAETKGKVFVPEMWQPSRSCDNPFCEWSKIREEVDAHRYSSARHAWEALEKLENKDEIE